MEKLRLTKFDVAERQLFQAIRMFFREEDAVSVHTLVEAANQVLSDIGKDFGAQSFLRENDWIKEGKEKEWLRHMFKSRNFFKHADCDKDVAYEFRTDINHFSLIDGISMYSTIKKSWVPETIVFQMWFCVEYPSLHNKDSDFNQMVENGVSARQIPESTNLKHFSELITTLRNSNTVTSGVTLEYGL
ncbi:hypothetical protein [Agarivorans albus]|uniref:hypothetical protein n=1 Tax=Agarivorans albus TaxID=182262 RepID=UPI0006870571|nr:hypothetical protein [Agarivorans albus]